MFCFPIYVTCPVILIYTSLFKSIYLLCMKVHSHKLSSGISLSFFTGKKSEEGTKEWQTLMFNSALDSVECLKLFFHFTSSSKECLHSVYLLYFFK